MATMFTPVRYIFKSRHSHHDIIIEQNWPDGSELDENFSAIANGRPEIPHKCPTCACKDTAVLSHWRPLETKHLTLEQGSSLLNFACDHKGMSVPHATKCQLLRNLSPANSAIFSDTSTNKCYKEDRQLMFELRTAGDVPNVDLFDRSTDFDDITIRTDNVVGGSFQLVVTNTSTVSVQLTLENFRKVNNSRRLRDYPDLFENCTYSEKSVFSLCNAQGDGQISSTGDKKFGRANFSFTIAPERSHLMELSYLLGDEQHEEALVVPIFSCIYANGEASVRTVELRFQNDAPILEATFKSRLDYLRQLISTRQFSFAREEEARLRAALHRDIEHDDYQGVNVDAPDNFQIDYDINSNIRKYIHGYRVSAGAQEFYLDSKLLKRTEFGAKYENFLHELTADTDYSTLLWKAQHVAAMDDLKKLNESNWSSPVTTQVVGPGQITIADGALKEHHLREFSRILLVRPNDLLSKKSRIKVYAGIVLRIDSYDEKGNQLLGIVVNQEITKNATPGKLIPFQIRAHAGRGVELALMSVLNEDFPDPTRGKYTHLVKRCTPEMARSILALPLEPDTKVASKCENFHQYLQCNLRFDHNDSLLDETEAAKHFMASLAKLLFNYSNNIEEPIIFQFINPQVRNASIEVRQFLLHTLTRQKENFSDAFSLNAAGTSKTTFVAELIVLCLLLKLAIRRFLAGPSWRKHSEQNRIPILHDFLFLPLLVIAEANPAINTLVTKLLSIYEPLFANNLLQRERLMRIFALMPLRKHVLATIARQKNREYDPAEILSKQLLSVSNFISADDPSATYHGHGTLFYPSCDKKINRNNDSTNPDICALYDAIFTTTDTFLSHLFTGGFDLFVEPSFVIVEECSQLSPAKLLVLRSIFPHSAFYFNGDPLQLACNTQVVVNRTDALQVYRDMHGIPDTAPYAADYWSPASTPMVIALYKTDHLQHINALKLRNNYRNPPSIVAAVATAIPLCDHLLSARPPVELTSSLLSILPVVKDHDVILLPVEGERSQYKHSWVCTAELKVALQLVKDLLSAGIDPKSIGITAGYGYAVTTLRLRGRLDNQASEVTIRTIDGYQGTESDHVIFTMARPAINSRHPVGFLKDYRRANVVMTRPRLKLYVVGSVEVAKEIPILSQLVGTAGTLSEVEQRTLNSQKVDDIILEQLSNVDATIEDNITGVLRAGHMPTL